jgi:hypothetical protein
MTRASPAQNVPFWHDHPAELPHPTTAHYGGYLHTRIAHLSTLCYDRDLGTAGLSPQRLCRILVR